MQLSEVRVTLPLALALVVAQELAYSMYSSVIW